MSEGLSPQARALLDAARGGMAPDAAAVRRMRGRLDAAMTRAAVKSGASGKLALGAKLGALAVIAAGAVAYV
ncbi:MAG TPA: hypothetical protein VFP84_03160, partial [Kofleriaceae bacterium]|nr:hypothetical protein [Kofleriaceae bacterium]